MRQASAHQRAHQLGRRHHHRSARMQTVEPSSRRPGIAQRSIDRSRSTTSASRTSRTDCRTRRAMNVPPPRQGRRSVPVSSDRLAAARLSDFQRSRPRFAPRVPDFGGFHPIAGWRRAVLHGLQRSTLGGHRRFKLPNSVGQLGGVPQPDQLAGVSSRAWPAARRRSPATMPDLRPPVPSAASAGHRGHGVPPSRISQAHPAAPLFEHFACAVACASPKASRCGAGDLRYPLPLPAGPSRR